MIKCLIQIKENKPPYDCTSFTAEGCEEVVKDFIMNVLENEIGFNSDLSFYTADYIVKNKQSKYLLLVQYRIFIGCVGSED